MIMHLGEIHIKTVNTYKIMSASNLKKKSFCILYGPICHNLKHMSVSSLFLGKDASWRLYNTYTSKTRDFLILDSTDV